MLKLLIHSFMLKLHFIASEPSFVTRLPQRRRNQKYGRYSNYWIDYPANEISKLSPGIGPSRFRLEYNEKIYKVSRRSHY